jgi:hypothetical protein
MQDQPHNQPFSESNLDSAEYRARLMRKLNCLIAVLEVATAKVRQALAGPAPDVERLARIHKNLQDTLEVCLRARQALDKRGELPASLSKDLSQVVDPRVVLGAGESPASSPSKKVSRCEMSAEERARFRKLEKIDRAMLADVDLDVLARQLQA